MSEGSTAGQRAEGLTGAWGRTAVAAIRGAGRAGGLSVLHLFPADTSPAVVRMALGSEPGVLEIGEQRECCSPGAVQGEHWLAGVRPLLTEAALGFSRCDSATGQSCMKGNITVLAWPLASYKL